MNATRNGLRLALALFSVGVSAQNTGRFAALTAKGLECIDQGRFREAANLLEEIWENDKSDPAVAENLAIAILYGDRDANRARDMMEAAIAGGGRASFLMQHAHEKLAAISTETSDYCPGRLSIYRDKMVFTSRTEPAHSFTVRAGELKEIKRNKWFGSADNVYHIRTTDNRNFNLRPRTWSAGETSLVVSLIKEYIQR